MEMYDNDLFVDVDDAKKHRENLERIRKLEHEHELQDKQFRKEPEFILQKPSINQNLTKPANNNVILNSHTSPIKIDHRGNVKGRHFNKTAVKIDKVTELYNQGLGIRKVAAELHLAKHTVINILKEHKGALIDAEKILSKQKEIKESKNNIIKALKCLVATDKKSPHTALELYNLGAELLKQYLDKQPAETVKLLIGNKDFTIDDLLNAMATILVRETMKLNDDFIEISPDTFALKTANLQDDDRTCLYMHTENGKWKSCRPPMYSQSRGTIGINQCRGLNNNCPQYTPKTRLKSAF